MDPAGGGFGGLQQRGAADFGFFDAAKRQCSRGAVRGRDPGLVWPQRSCALGLSLQPHGPRQLPFVPPSTHPFHLGAPLSWRHATLCEAAQAACAYAIPPATDIYTPHTYLHLIVTVAPPLAIRYHVARTHAPAWAAAGCLTAARSCSDSTGSARHRKVLLRGGRGGFRSSSRPHAQDRHHRCRALGTSAAYYLKRAQDRLASGNFSANTEALDITIYERENRIGGRVAVVYPHDDDTHDPIELGASIFADVNLNLRRAVKQFALETGAHMGMDGQMGIWDGQQFLFEGDQSSWWTSAKFFLRYGYSAITTESVVKKQLAAFGALYNPSFLHARGQAERNAAATASGYPWTSIERLADAVNASALAATTGMQFFKERRVSELFIEEMVEAATRVNYAQDTDQIHGFGALVSLAASGATGVKKGNYRMHLLSNLNAPGYPHF